jgi:hypothetical protein
MKLGKIIDFGGKTAKVVVGLGVSVTVAALTDVATEKITSMNGSFIDSKVKGIKNFLKVK